MGVVFILFMVVVTGRLWQKQVLEHGQYLAMAKSQQTYSKEEVAQRGKILIHDDLDNPGNFAEVAINVQKYSVSVIPKNASNKNSLAQQLATLLSLQPQDIFTKINNDKLYIPPIAKGVDSLIADKISAENLKGVVILPEYDRLYPENNLLSQTLGFVDNEGVGKYGVENYYNSELTGYNGKKTAEKDTFGRTIDIVSDSAPKNGDTVYLTIDRSVQYYVEKALEKALSDYQADSGSVIIVEPKTGRVIAMTNKPDFDPNLYNLVTADKLSVFMNDAIAGAWEPGSIMKPVTMALAIDQGKVTPDTTGDYSNMVVVDGHEIHTATNVAFGHETMTQVLENSDNVAMVDVANKLGNQAMYDNLKKFGLLDKTGIDISGESTGSVPRLRDWRNISRANISFGQGISITPIQMVMAYAALANGGKLVTPQIVDKIVQSDGETSGFQTKEVGQVVQPDTAAKIKEMLVSVVTHREGQRAAVTGFRVAGKTGTAQVAKTDGSGYDENMHNGSFAGFAPADDPKFAMLVRLNNPKTVKFAESSAAPVFGQIANYLLNYFYKVPASP